ncbi:LCP family protein [Serpentinicella sp. ANB-PHB4]|uniref:LCP family protein n=1 Tax=Serpentinicella sp. ANB-PHB4 TaxID=3074076 RepID=UPI0028661D98|nr:LCP family protein [Serpentinicella sp. ANB-PHB4]MDR5659943.1 LCP family protein [Serpentinicella sp. ANB-PHB4]
MSRKKNKKSKMTKKKKILIVALVLLMPLLIYGTSVGVRLYNIYSTMHESLDDEEFEAIDPEDLIDYDNEPEADVIPEDEVEAYKFLDDRIYDQPRSARNSDHLNIMLMGIDSRTIGGAGRADSLMVVQYNKRTKKAAILSIPRDTYVRIPGRGYDKINHASAFGGTRLLKETVEGYLDIHIDHYARVDMQSFTRAIDAIGGVQITVPQDMVHTNGRVLFRAGSQHMNGDDVLRYTTARKLRSGGGDDFGRIKRQQQVVMTILTKVSNELSLNQALSLLEDISPFIRTDITPNVVMSNWSAFTSLNLNTVDMSTLDGTGFRHNRIYYYRVPIEDARKRAASLTQ